MIGYYAFCNRSGAPLSKPENYDDRGQAWRHVLPDEDADGGHVGELTNGEIRSSRRALLAHFRRSHRRHHEYDDECYRRASLAIRRLKRTASGGQADDRHVWYALQRRLRDLGYETDWMHAHAGLRCPSCQGRLRFQETAGDVRAECGTNCDGADADRLAEIRETVASLYAATFEDATAEPEAFLQP